MAKRAAFVFALTVVAAVRADATPILLHQFTFDGSTVVDSVGSAAGSLQGGASLSGGNLVLNGVNGFVELNQQVVPIGSPAALSVTVRAQQASPQTGGYVELISQGQSGSDGFYIGHDPARQVRLTDKFLTTGVLLPSDGAFHLYSLTSDPSGGTYFYIDSTLAFSNSQPLVTSANGTNTRFGRQFDPYSEFFDGSIDEIRIYDGALSADDVAGIASPVPEPGSILLLGSGLLGVTAARRRRRA